jgi:heptosyltransferase-1
MGDVIHTLPAVAALRSALPDARIGWIVEERWAELLCARNAPRSGARNALRPLIEFVHVVDTKRWRKSPFSPVSRRQMAAVRRELQDQHYELAIDFQGAVKSGILTRFAKTALGMERPREAPARWFYNRRITTTGAHVVEQYHSLAEAAAGQSLAVCAPSFPDSNLEESSVAAMLQSSDDPLALINPGAGWGAKQWPAERYSEVARALANDGLLPIINFGPGEEKLANQVETASGGKARPVTCSIGELISLTRRARLFIGGDTGPLHLAAALQVPVVAIFGPTDPARNGPYGTKSMVLRNAVSRTSLSHTSAPDPGLLRITADEVIAAARTLLGSAHV